MTNRGDAQKMSKGHRSSLSVEEASGRDDLGGEVPLRKGPWTSAEDAILIDFVNKYGAGNWNIVEKHSGLARCGKSCRLRWANHLRPDLKKGAFTEEEEHKIIKLHFKMGNKWARMAEELPGRTDNEIKNYWNTRIKRIQRAGLPMYPAGICPQVLNDSQESLNGSSQHADVSDADDFDIPELDFKKYKFSPGYPSYMSSIFDITESSMFEQGSSHFPMMHPPKCLRESDMLYNSLDSCISSAVPVFDQYMDYIPELPTFSFLGGPIFNTNDQFHNDNIPGSHAGLNGNTSSSAPISGAMKLELPSLQYMETQQGSWGTPASPLPSLESVDTLIQSPPAEQTQSDPVSPRSSGLLELIVYGPKILKGSNDNSLQTADVDTLIQSRPAEQTQSDPVAPRSSGLLEAIVYGPKILKGSNNNSLQQTADECLPNEVVKSSTLNPCMTEWDEQGEPISMCSGDGLQSAETTRDHDIKHEAVTQDPTNYPAKTENLNRLDLTRPDALFDLGWFGSDSGYNNYQSVLKDAL